MWRRMEGYNFFYYYCSECEAPIVYFRDISYPVQCGTFCQSKFEAKLFDFLGYGYKEIDMAKLFLENAIASGDLHQMKRENISYLDGIFLDEQERLKPVEAHEVDSLPRSKLVQYCNQKGFYSIPTTELIEFLESEIECKDKALEIGAGNGVYGRTLGIKMVDNYMQHPKNKNKFNMAYYAMKEVGITTVPYGDDVEEKDAKDAISLYKPNVILAAWFTQKYNPRKPHMKGNMYGVSYQWMFNRKHVDKIILIGNKNVHSNVDIMHLPHRELELPGDLFSRAMNRGNDRVFIWEK